MQLAATTQQPHDNQDSNNGFTFSLSVSKEKVYSKQGGTKVIDFALQHINSSDVATLSGILTRHNYSTNTWSGTSSNANYAGMTGVVLDFDGTMSLEEARQEFAEFNHVIHTTTSHLAEVGTERFRVILPMVASGVIFTAAEVQQAVYSKLLTAYPNADKACKDAGRKYFPHSSELGAPFQLFINTTGRYFTVDLGGEAVTASDPAKSSTFNLQAPLNSREQLTKVIRYCPFIKWCRDNAAHLPEPLWYAMISNLCRFDGGWELIQQISAQDKTPGRYDRANTDRKIRHAYLASGPMTYEEILRQGWTGQAPDEFRSPAGWAYYFDQDEFLQYLKTVKVSSLANILERHFREDFQYLTSNQQDVWLSVLCTNLSIGKSELQRMARNALLGKALTGQNLKQIIAQLRNSNAEDEDIGKAIYRWFEENGMRAYRDEDHRGYWLWEGEVYEVDEEKRFDSLIFEYAELTDAGVDRRRIWNVFVCLTDLKGQLLDSASWVHTDQQNCRVWIRPNLKCTSILCIDENGVHLERNGNNEERILLTAKSKMKPLEFQTISAEEYGRAWKTFERLILNNMPCDEMNRLLYACWALCYPAIGFVLTRPIMRCEGSSEQGKSRAMELWNYFVYGKRRNAKITPAAAYTEGTSSPILFFDNLEKSMFNKEYGELFLQFVTGVTKIKRKIGTDHDTVEEQVDCLVNSSGVEPLGKTEHHNRTFVIEFDLSRWASDGWSERVYTQITQERPLLFFAHMEMMSRVIRDVKAGKLDEWEQWLSVNHKSHAKKRANSFIALMAIVLEHLIIALDADIMAHDVLNKWIEMQNEEGKQTTVGTNMIVDFLEALAVEAKNLFAGTAASVYAHEEWARRHYEVHVSNGFGDRTLSGTARQFQRTFQALSGPHRMNYSYHDARQLAKRIADSKKTIEEAGIIVGMDRDASNTTVYKFTFPD